MPFHFWQNVQLKFVAITVTVTVVQQTSAKFAEIWKIYLKRLVVSQNICRY